MNPLKKYETNEFSTVTTLPVVLILLLTFLSNAYAFEKRTSILAVRGSESYPLEPYITILEDVDNRLTIEDVLSESVESQFVPSRQQHINFGYSHSAYWLRMEILCDISPDQNSLSHDWYFEVGRTLIKEAELFVVYPDGRWVKAQSDVRIRYQDRPIRLVNSVFPISMKKGEKIKIYLRIKSDSALYFPITLWGEQEFVRKVAREEFLYGIFWGGMSVMLLYNIFLFVAMRNRSYFYYSCYLLSVLLFVGIESGHGAAWLTDGRIIFDKFHVTIAIWCTWLFGLLFAHRFLEIRERHPLMHQFFKPLFVYSLLCCGLSLQLPPQAALIVSVYFCGYASALMPLLGMYAWFSGNKIASYFTLAWLCNVTGFVAVSLVATGRAPATPLLMASLPLGTLMEAVMLSFALAERIKSAQKEVILAQSNSVINLTKYQSLFENALEGIYQINLRGKLANVNPSMVALLGFSSVRDLMRAGEGALKVFYKNADIKLRDLIRGGALRNEIRFVNRQGTGLVVEHSARLVKDTRGRPSYLEGRVIDVTERLHREQAIRERLRERREKLSAEMASNAKSRFLTNMSFEIRSSLTPIIGYSESLLDPDVKGASKHDLVVGVTANAQALLQLVNDILDYSKIEANKMPVDRIEFDLFSVVHSVERLIAPLMENKGLKYNVKYDWPLPSKIVTDPTRLKQILHNVLKKTIACMTGGIVSVRVSWAKGESVLNFLVEATGTCYVANEIETLHHGRDDTRDISTVLEHDGIGIAIAQQLTSLLGGRWSAEFNAKNGYRFHVGIGCKVSADEKYLHLVPCVDEKPRKEENVIPHLVGHILVAEDNPVNQKLISRIITKTGAKLTVVGDGEQALRAATDNTFHLILMDINMPVMGGLEATQKLREIGCSQPIYALTAEHGSEEIRASIDAGCNGHLTKPIEIKSFYQTLAQYLPANPAAG